MQNATRYPLLRKLAMLYLGPPLSSVTSERLFSSTQDICTDSCSNLLSENAEMLIALKVNQSLNNSDNYNMLNKNETLLNFFVTRVCKTNMTHSYIFINS